jgi:hypothetical protein
MTYAAPTAESYDDGLVHSHDWSRSTPPGTHHAEGRRNQQGGRDREDGVAHEHR